MTQYQLKPPLTSTEITRRYLHMTIENFTYIRTPDERWGKSIHQETSQALIQILVSIGVFKKSLHWIWKKCWKFLNYIIYMKFHWQDFIHTKERKNWTSVYKLCNIEYMQVHAWYVYITHIHVFGESSLHRNIFKFTILNHFIKINAACFCSCKNKNQERVKSLFAVNIRTVFPTLPDHTGKWTTLLHLLETKLSFESVLLVSIH